MLDDLRPMRLFAEVLEGIARSEFAELSLAVLHERAPVPRPSLPARLARAVIDGKTRRQIGFSLYNRWDRRNVPPDRDPFVPVDVAPLLANVPQLRVRPIVDRFNHTFPPDAIAALRAADLDVLLRFGFNILRGDVLGVARYGIWSYHHGDNDEFRGAAPGIWELIEGAPSSGAMLQVLTEQLDAGFVLAKGIYPTVRGLSAARNRLRPYWGTSTFVLQKLRELHRDGWDAVRAHAVPDEPFRGKRRMYRAPTNAELLAWVWRAGTGWVRARASGTSPVDQEWELAVRPRSDAPRGDVATYARIRPPAGRFWADPCAVADGETTYVFFEDWVWATQRGHISCGRLEGDRLLDVRTVLQRDHHLSFPFVFEREGTWYMIPETKEAGHVRLLRATAFPDTWVDDVVLLDEPAVDTVLHEQDGTWYMFTTLVDRRSGAPAHCLFVADDMRGPWRLHPSSPLATTLRGIRSAGPLVRAQDGLIRPVQDASRGYGAGLEWRRVDELTPETFVETALETLVPPPDRDGGHSYTATAGYEVIDLCWNRRRRDPPGTDRPVRIGDRPR